MSKEQAQIDALHLLEELTIRFPGLLDGVTEVSGADIVDDLNFYLEDLDSLREHLEGKRSSSW